jgi:hypothetical protein
MNPNPKEYTIAVILLRSRLATRFLRTNVRSDFYSKKRKRYVKAVSILRWNFNASTVSPKIMPNRMNKNICMIMLRLKESKLNGSM